MASVPCPFIQNLWRRTIQQFCEKRILRIFTGYWHVTEALRFEQTSIERTENYKQGSRKLTRVGIKQKSNRHETFA